MAVDNVTTQSAVGIDGNKYTTSVSNDTLTNNDFLALMLEEMKQQDPTNPMDSDKMLADQLQMSTIQTNADMAEAMQKLEVSYATSALATASSLIGRVIEDGSVGDNGEANSYVVSKVENKDGSLYLTTNLITGVEDAIKDTETNKVLKYDSTGLIYDANGEATDVRVSLNSEGRFNYNDDGSLMLLDSDGNVITDEDITSKYVYAGSATIYADKTTTIPMNAITKVE